MKKELAVKDININFFSKKEADFISLTDIAKYKNPGFPADVIKNWMRLKNTIEFLGFWEKINNPNFKLVEFDQF
ncbi:KilA-N domain-containing protein, partial [Patescibacteria group bacterium]|nr:KilA-N domain-containing protein [Patescibacteria group bacterium]